MIYKMNDMEMNDEMNELVHEMNRCTLVNEINVMKVTRQICIIPLLKYIII